MKKVLLSLAALAFVATGTVSCSSDDGGPNNGGGTNDDTPGTGDDTPGGDDTQGGDDTPGGTSTFTWDCAEYDVDTATTGVVVNAESQMRAFNLDTDGDGEGDTIVTRWIVYTHAGDDFQTASEGVYTEVYIPVNGDNAVYPHE